jgi:hypothetical protein
MKARRWFLRAVLTLVQMGTVSVTADRAAWAVPSSWTDVVFYAPFLVCGGRAKVRLRTSRNAGGLERETLLPFSLAGWDSGRIRVPLCMTGEDSSASSVVEVDRVFVDTPVGTDTLQVKSDPVEDPLVGHPAMSRVHPLDAAAEPLWRPGDGDVLIVSCDALNGALTPLLEDLSARGYRCARTRLSLVERDYPEEDAAGAIQDAVADACRDFRTRPLALILVGPASEDIPQNDLLPTLHRPYEHEYMGSYDATYAEDGGFGDLIVGRIPVRSGTELSAYVAKLSAYRAQPDLPRVHFVVGDAAVNRDNSDRRRAAQQLLDILQGVPVLQGTARYASSYMPVNLLANRQRALADLTTDLAQGVGLLAVFGNNIGPTNLVHAWEVPPGGQTPWLRPSEMPTAGRLPIALFGSCLNGAFDEDGLFPGFDSPAETWVREPNRGVIAAVAPSHLTTFFDDWEISGQVLRRISRGDGAPLGGIVTGLKQSLLREWTRGARSTASIRMLNLLGDPLLVPRLGVDQLRLAGGFESSGAWPTQNTVESGRGWTTGDLITGTSMSRVVGPTAGVGPVEGERMMCLSASFREGAYRRAVAWKLFSCDTSVEPGSVLRAWVRVGEGGGRLAIDACTAGGRLLSEDLLDMRGLQGDPAHAPPEHGRWRPIIVRLGRWAGDRVEAIYVRYERTARDPEDAEEVRLPRSMNAGGIPPETFRGYVDGLTIDPEEVAPFMDGAFARDDDGDGRADAWTAPWPRSMEAEPARAPILLDDGTPSVVLSAEDGSFAGISQLLAPTDEPQLQLGWDSRSPDGGRMRVGLVDPMTGVVYDEATTGPIGDTWAGEGANLTLPERRTVLLELRPVAGTVHVRVLRIEAERPGGSKGEAQASSPSVRIQPNPSTGPLRITWAAGGGAARKIEIYDVSGRRIASWRPDRVAGETRLADGDLRLEDGRLPATGIYFVRLETDRASATERLLVIR